MITRIIDLPPRKSFYLFGPRQTGKSTLIGAYLKGKKQFTINLLHSETLLKYIKDPSVFRKEAAYAIERNGARFVFIDEIQKVPALLDEVQALYDQYSKVQFIVSGSSARKLRHGASNLLAGRLVQRYLHPFVYTELKKNFSINDTLRFGTLPPVFNTSEEDKKEFLLSYVNTYLREEIQQEALVRNLGGYSRFLEIVASQNGEIVNYCSIARDCSLPSRTVQSYYEILEDTLVGIKMEAWRKSIRKRLLLHSKFFLFDVGVSNAICRRFDLLGDPVIRGRLFEQWLVTETYSYINYFYPEVRLYYWRSSAGAEVDILFERGGELLAALEIKSGKNITRKNFNGLLSFAQDNPGIPLFLVCSCEHPYKENNIEVLPWEIYFEQLAGEKFFRK